MYANIYDFYWITELDFFILYNVLKNILTIYFEFILAIFL